jgi:predicted ATP-grasp superfamily ATP-dependent carboligase
MPPFKNIDIDVSDVGAGASAEIDIPIEENETIVTALVIVPLNDALSSNFDVQIYEKGDFNDVDSVYLAQAIPERLDDELELYYVDKDKKKQLHLKIYNNCSLQMSYRIKAKYKV